MATEEYRNYNIFYDSIRKYHVKSKGKGSIPKSLSGSYTSVGVVKEAIDLYYLRGVSKSASTSR